MIYFCDSCDKAFEVDGHHNSMVNCPYCGEEVKGDIEEISTTSNLDGGEGPIQTPFAFGKLKKNKYEKFGSRTMLKKSMHSEYLTLANIMISQPKLFEISYKAYKEDDSQSSSKKVNIAIKEINRLIYEVEKIIRQNLRLKNETDLNGGSFWKASRSRMYKVSERLNRISNYLKHLSV